MNKLLDVLIPRFVTDHIAAIDLGEGNYKLLYRVEDMHEDEEYDTVVVVKAFNFLGIGLFGKYYVMEGDDE